MSLDSLEAKPGPPGLSDEEYRSVRREKHPQDTAGQGTAGVRNGNRRWLIALRDDELNAQRQRVLIDSATLRFYLII